MAINTDNVDISKLSFSELQALLQETQTAIERKRVEELKVLADGYAKKLQMSGFGISEGIGALKPYLNLRSGPKAAASSSSGGGAGNSSRAPKYRNPDNANDTWVGVGKQPQWFRDHLAKGTPRDSMLI